MATDNSTLINGINGISSSIFGNTTEPEGSDFKDPVLVAAIVVNGICAVAFAALVVATWWIEGKKARGRRVFGLLSGIIVTMFLSYLRTTADEIILELNVNQPTVHIALIVIEQVLSAGADSALPLVVYYVIKNRLSHIENNEESYSTVNYTHLGIVILLTLLRVVDASLDSYGQIFVRINAPEMAWGINISNWYRNIHLTYMSLFCAVSVEMFAWAVFIFNKSRSEITQSRSQIPKYLVAIVTPFLVLRSVVNVAFAVVYVYLNYNAQKSSGLIQAVLLGIVSVILYLGLVLIGLKKDWFLPRAPITYVDQRQDGYGSPIVTHQYDGKANQAFASTTRVR